MLCMCCNFLAWEAEAIRKGKRKKSLKWQAVSEDRCFLSQSTSTSFPQGDCWRFSVGSRHLVALPSANGPPGVARRLEAPRVTGLDKDKVWTAKRIPFAAADVCLLWRAETCTRVYVSLPLSLSHLPCLSAGRTGSIDPEPVCCSVKSFQLTFTRSLC